MGVYHGREMPLHRPLALILAVAAPHVAAAEEGAGGGLGGVAWLLAAWAIASVASTVVVSIWFRARARANEQLSQRIRREDWLAAAGAQTREPIE